MQYRRAKEKDGTYFFTVNVAKKRSLLGERIDDLRDVVKKLKQQYLFHIDATVVLLDNLHALWTLPEEYADNPKRWIMIKSGFSRCIPKNEYRRKCRISKGEKWYMATTILRTCDS
jgi:putative transposase